MKIDYQPNRIIRPFERSMVEIRLFGKNGGDTDWSVESLGDHSDAIPAFVRISCAALKASVKKIYAPRSSTFNALICNSQDLKEVFRHGKESDSEHVKNFAIHRGVDADGCDVPKGAAVWIASADCPTIVARSRLTGKLIAAHAGRDSLVDRGWLDCGARQRQFDSVVNAIIHAFKNSGDSDPRNLDVFVTLGIGPYNFVHDPNHPKHGRANRRLLNHFGSFSPNCVFKNSISLFDVIAAQFKVFGTSRISSDNIDTFEDDTWWSNSRAASALEKNMRNGVMVINR